MLGVFRPRIKILRAVARDVGGLRGTVEQQLREQVRELIAERRAFVEGRLLERRRLTHAWDAEVRDPGLVRWRVWLGG